MNNHRAFIKINNVLLVKLFAGGIRKLAVEEEKSSLYWQFGIDPDGVHDLDNGENAGASRSANILLGAISNENHKYQYLCVDIDADPDEDGDQVSNLYVSTKRPPRAGWHAFTNIEELTEFIEEIDVSEFDPDGDIYELHMYTEGYSEIEDTNKVHFGRTGNIKVGCQYVKFEDLEEIYKHAVKAKEGK